MWILAVLTFALPWVVTPGTPNPFLEGKELLLLAGGWSLILWTGLRLPTLPSQGLRNPFFVWLGLFLLGGGLLHFHWQYLWRTPEQTQIVYNVYTWLPTISCVMILLLLRTLALHWFHHPPSLLQLTQWMCLSGAAVASYAILQVVGLDQWFVHDVANGNTWKTHVSAGFGNPSYLAIYLAALLPLCFLFKPKRYLFYAGLMGVALYLTGVRYAWGLACIGLLGYGVSRWWRVCQPIVRLSLVVGLCLASLYGGQLAWRWAQGDERWTIWRESWQLTQTTSPPRKTVESWTGRGIGSYELLTKKQGYGWAHNEWLQALIELGVIGTGLLGAAVAWTTLRAWQRATNSLIDAGWFGTWLVMLAASLIHFTFHLPTHIWVGLCAWAVFEREELGYG